MPELDVSPVTFKIRANPTARIGVSASTGAQVILVPSGGAQGPPGPPGPGYAGEAWFYGSGPPGTIIGSQPGDNYMDLDTGTIWKLGD